MYGQMKTLTIGSAADNDIQVSVPNVSRYHCRLERTAEGIFVQDLGSTNGTFVDGQSISRTAVRPGQRVKLSQHYELDWNLPKLASWLAIPLESPDPKVSPAAYFDCIPSQKEPRKQAPIKPPQPARIEKKQRIEPRVENTETAKEEMPDSAVCCPNCGSASVHADKRGYKAGSGCCGYLMCGPLGFLCGQTGANKLQITCMKCGHSWKP